jgi:hypothetical protein
MSFWQLSSFVKIYEIVNFTIILVQMKYFYKELSKLLKINQVMAKR